MFQRAIAISGLLLMTACSRAPKTLTAEELRLKENLIGGWTMVDSTPRSAGQGAVESDQLRFLKNGDVTDTMVLRGTSGTSNRYEFSGTYEIVDSGRIRLDFGNQFGNRVCQLRLSSDEMVLTESNGDYVKYARAPDTNP